MRIFHSTDPTLPMVTFEYLIIHLSQKKASMSLKDMLPKLTTTSNSSEKKRKTLHSSYTSTTTESKKKGIGGVEHNKKQKSANFVPPPNHKFKKPSYAELKERKLNLVKGLKANWNTARTKAVDGNERDKTIINMLASIKGQIHQVALRHDTSRVVQTILQFGTVEQKQTVLSELGMYTCTV